MRIGLFSNAYHPVVSGVVNSLNEIRRGLLKRNHTPFLFAPEARGYRESHAGVFRFPSLELDRSVEFPVPIPYSAKLARLVPKMGLDLIHSHHPILVGATAAGAPPRLRVLEPTTCSPETRRNLAGNSPETRRKLAGKFP